MKVKHVIYTIAALTALLLIAGGVRYAGIHIGGFFTKEQAGVDREVFKTAKPYTEAAAAELASYYRQYREAEDASGKKLIQQMAIERFPNLDLNVIESKRIKQWYIKSLEGGQP